jgi:TetR/AcrR family transcriptional regulator, repressor of fatR-cypB operon
MQNEFIFIYLCLVARQKDDTKIQHIFTATLKRVLHDGFSGLKMADIAKDAGMATGTLYIYFKNKAELIDALYIYLKKKNAAALIKGYDDSLSFMDGFEKLWKQYFKICMDKPEESAFLEQYYRSPFLSEKTRQQTDSLLAPVFILLERGKKEKLVKDLDSFLLLAQLVGPVHELVRQHQLGVLKISTHTINNTFRMAWDGIKN